MRGILVPPEHGTVGGVLQGVCDRREGLDLARGMLRTRADQGDLAVLSSLQLAPPQALGLPRGTPPENQKQLLFIIVKYVFTVEILVLALKI